MRPYFLDKQPNKEGYHLIHIRHCYMGQIAPEKIYLGDFDNCLSAMQEAKKYYDKVAFCKSCLPECVPKDEE